MVNSYNTINPYIYIWKNNLEERRQALGTGLSPRLPKGGQRQTDLGQRLIDSVGGDSYGK